MEATRIFLQELLDETADEVEGTKDQENWTMIVGLLTELELVGQEKAYLLFKTVRFRKCGEKSDMGQDGKPRGLIYWALSEYDRQKAQRMRALHELMVLAGCEHFQGVCPPTTVERQISAAIKRLKEEIDRM